MINDRHDETTRDERATVDPRDTDHPTGTEDAAENAATESPS